MGLAVSVIAGQPVLRVLCDNPGCRHDLTCAAAALIAVNPNPDEQLAFSQPDAEFFMVCSSACADQLAGDYDAHDWPRYPYALAMGGMIARDGFLPFMEAATYLETLTRSLEHDGRPAANGAAP